MSSLKEKLDRIWNTFGCADPLRKANWKMNCLGWIRWVRGSWSKRKNYFWKEPKV